MITVADLSKSYGNKEVLTGINIQLETGKIYGIVGENGSGKTTLFKCIAGLESYSGQVLTTVGRLKDTLGYLQTEPYFFPRITGREYIQLLCNARKTAAGSIDDKNIFDLPLDQYATTYSTGMKKKLALTALLLQENNVFILDEPFNGVDIQSNVIIHEIIERLKAMGKTLLISSHIFSTLNNTCDSIFLLSAGKLVRRVERYEFDALEKEMKDVFVGNKIDRLQLK